MTESEESKRSAIKETARWIHQQIDHVWRALGVQDEGSRGLRTEEKGMETGYVFVYRGRILARARSYYSQDDGQWRFELTEVEQGRYKAVKAYFSGRT